MTAKDSVLTEAGSRSFSEAALTRGPEWLRDRVYHAPLTAILGVDLQDTAHALSTAYTERATQVNTRFAAATDPEARAAVVDLLAILIRSYEILTDAAERERYVAADQPNFSIHCPDFTFATAGGQVVPRGARSQKRTPPSRRATPPPEGPATGPVRPRRARVGTDLGTGPIRRRRLRASAKSAAPSSAPRSGSPAASANQTIEASTASPAPKVAPATPDATVVAAASSAPNPKSKGWRVVSRRPGILKGDRPVYGDGVAPSRPGPEPQVIPPAPRTARAAKAQRRSRGRRDAVAVEEMTATKGPLAFSVGVARRGLLHVGGVYAVAFVASLLLLAAGFGARELSLAADEPMIIIRAVLLCGLAVAGVCVLRRESPLRFGLMPRWGGLAIALPVAVALGWFASVLARFEIEPGNTNLWGGIALLVAVRAVGEATFFQGFVTRTLLVELRTPALAVLASGVLYGIYGATYAVIAGGTGFQTLFACFVYAFGAGVPLGLMYLKTRSLPAVIVCNWIILMGSAWGGVAYAVKMAG